MIKSAKELKNHHLHASDGEVGRVKGLYFDNHWNTRYLIVETGTWLDSRQVLIATTALNRAGADPHKLSVNLTRAQVRGSPPVDTGKPVSRHSESLLSSYYGWTPYWTDSVLGASGALHPSPIDATPPSALGTGFGTAAGPSIDPLPVLPETSVEETWIVHSTHEATDYHIEATDGAIGHVEDFLFDDQTWNIRFLVVDTRNWLPGKKVLVAPEWIQDIRWNDSKTNVNLTRDAIKDAPEYDPGKPFEAEHAARLHEHHRRLLSPRS